MATHDALGPLPGSSYIWCGYQMSPNRALLMKDAHGLDEMRAGPVDDLSPHYDLVESNTDLPAIMRDQIEHFFYRYKEFYGVAYCFWV
jgi:inorganic pyrophosphatase